MNLERRVLLAKRRELAQRYQGQARYLNTVGGLLGTARYQELWQQHRQTKKQHQIISNMLREHR